MALRLVGLLALVVLGWLLGRAFSIGRRRPAPGRGQAARSGDRMVRDRVCNTFLPASRALRLHARGQEHYFCSEACRGKFLAGEPVEATPGPGRA